MAVPAKRARTMRRAYILLVVLGFTAVVSSLGLAFIEANSTVMPEADNRHRAARAQYLAESGIALGTHFLMYPPTTVASGSFWPGDSAIAIDETPDYTDVAITQDATDPNLFTLNAVGVAFDFDGNVKGKRAITAQVILPEARKWRIPYAYLGTGNTWLKWPNSVEGDMHSNGNLQMEGWCQGNVTAAGWIGWSGGGPPASITSFAGPFTAPTVDPAIYAAYTVNRTNYTAYNYTKTDMGNGDANTLNGTDMSATNPGRIILAPAGDFTLKNDVNLTGTLVVDGTLFVRKGVQLTAVTDFPALIVTGGIEFTKNDASLDVAGSVLCGGWIWDQGKTGVQLDVNGAFVGASGLWVDGTGGAYTFTWDTDLSTFWDFEGVTNPDPITILTWQEN